MAKSVALTFICIPQSTCPGGGEPRQVSLRPKGQGQHRLGTASADEDGEDDDGDDNDFKTNSAVWPSRTILKGRFNQSPFFSFLSFRTTPKGHFNKSFFHLFPPKNFTMCSFLSFLPLKQLLPSRTRRRLARERGDEVLKTYIYQVLNLQ